ncbi:MAG: HTTM domain-containing protein, partial [Flavobacteriales bacterium]|nr:HTTM domain-containing protein [Flavobacteriales bacterium]
MIDKAKIHQFFNPFQQVSIAPLIVFRIIFGALMLIGTSRFILNGWVQKLYIEPTFFFPFLGFEWVKPLPGNWMFLPFILLFVSALFFMLGFFYRIASVVLFLSFTYIELLDKTNYLNHYYFVSLVAFLMQFLPANRYCSLDVYLNLTPKQFIVSKWNIGILKFQLGIVYVFAGIAKLNSDWLFDANPLKIWLQAHHHLPVV